MTLFTSDWDLITACRTGDAQAWEVLVSRYERLVFSIALSYGLSRDDAADVTQTAFLALFRCLATLSPDSRLSGWLATVAHRQTRRILQRGRYEYHDALELIDERAPSLGPTHSDPIERWELVEWLHHGQGALGERCRRLLLALYFDPAERSYAEIADQLAMPVGSIGPNRARCLEQLKQILQNRS